MASERRESDTGCCKYDRAFKQLIPIRPSPKKKDVLPTRYAGLFSFVSVSWLTPLMWKAYKGQLNPQDLWSLPREESSKTNGDRLERLWTEEMTQASKAGRKPRLWKAVWRFCRTRVIIILLLGIAMDTLFLLGPMLFLRLILDYINGVEVDPWYGAVLLVSKILTTMILPIAFFNSCYICGIHTGSRTTGALQAIIYRKVLTLKTGGENLNAQIVNLTSNDTERVFEAITSCVFISEVPLLFFFSLGYCVYLIGPWALVGFAAYSIFYPIMAVIAKGQSIIREKTIKETDRRVGLMSEILNSIRLIKMYAWEDPFAKKIADIRNCEMKRHQTGALLSAITNTLTPSISIFATITTLVSYTLAGNAITSADAFTLLSIFSMIGFTVSVTPYTVKCMAEANIALRRIQNLLTLPEHHPTAASEDSATFAIQIEEGNFAWEITDISYKGKEKNKQSTEKQGNVAGGRDIADETVDSPSETKAFGENPEAVTDPMAEKQCEINKTTGNLSKISLSVLHGKLIGVCGSIGSGKSSLISAICGDMKKENGNMYINGRVALVTQQAWIYNGTLRDNLLLGCEYHEERYLQALHVCCLQSDLDLLPAGDMTEIGERGINLSGGQKQRVNLARAVYSERDIYLLDDPLSAVDARVANDIFTNCIKGHLKGKTILLVTHALHLLEQCDEIIVMKDGKINEHGTHSQLLEQRGDYHYMVGGVSSGQKQLSQESKPQKDTESMSPKENEEISKEGKVEDGKLTTEETLESGTISTRVYKIFIKVCGGGCLVTCLLLTVIIFVLLELFNSIWLKIWLDEGDGLIEERQLNVTQYNLTLSEDELKGSIVHNPLLWMYQSVYAASFISFLTVGVIKGIGITFSVLKGASRLHNAMFTSVIRSPMSFFDTTPSGRILNRFSRDLDEFDTRIPFFSEFVLQGLLSMLGQVILICTIYVWFVIPLVIVIALFICLDVVLNVGVRELKRIDNNRKSPVVQHFGSSLSGLSVIRTFDQQQQFSQRMYQYLDDHTVAHLVFRLSSRWHVFNTNVLTVTINSCVSAICIFTKGLVSTATAGLALTAITTVCDYLPYLMRMKTEFLSRFTTVERLVEYSYDLKREEVPNENPGKPVPKGWPEHGRVEIKEVCLRYRPELPLVLHDIEATFNSGQRVGVVGRTGAGKSSLIGTLLRLVEVESGSVVIDGVDISTVSLHTLRSAISVIPQDPILFQGSIRYNLDPFEEHNDTALWEALEQSHLKRVVQQQEKGLQAPVATAGENFSVGERQLICLARALLRRSKILLLDEATASVDPETDQMIQSTIRKAFSDCTVITIAHRLNTITNYEKILVLQDGRVVEFDCPETLMMTEGSLFRDMMLAMGVSTLEEMKALT